MSQEFFHLSGPLLEQGSVICPGNYGRVVRTLAWQHAAAVREMALESARLARFRDRPSRLNAAFVFLTREEAIHFKTAEKWGAHILYRVELCDPSALSHVTDWRLLTPHGTLRPDWADAYWVGINSVATSIPGIDWAVATNGIPLREMLTLSQLRVKERLD